VATKAQLQREASARGLFDVVREFLAHCREPVFVEAGEQPIQLVEGRYDLEPRGQGCVLHAWGEEGNLVRRIIAVKSQKQDRMEVLATSFGRRDIRLAIVDESNKTGRVRREAGHARFREYRDWTLSHFTSAPDLEHTISPSYTRGALSLGREMWAVIGVPADLSARAA